MTVAKVLRTLLALAATLIVVWAFVDVGTRIVRGGAHGRPVELTLLHWGDPPEVKIVEGLVRRYERENPHVKIKRIHASEFETKLKTMMAAGTPPDLFYLNYFDLPELASLDLLQPIDEFVAADRAAGKAAFLDDYFPILIDAFKYDGEEAGRGPLYGLPKDFTTILMYVNLDLFEEAGVEVPYDGWTWAEFEAAARKITDLPPRPTGKVYGAFLSFWPDNLRGFLWLFGGEFFGPGGFEDVALDEPGAQRALSELARLRLVEGTVYNPTGIARDGGQEFFTGNIGMYGPRGRWETPRMRSIESFRWDVVPMPYDTEPASTIFNVAWVMSKATPHKQEAWELMKFLAGPEGQAQVAREGLAIPTLKSVAESDAFLDPAQTPAHTHLFLDAVKYARLASSPKQREFKQFVDEETVKATQLGMQSPLQAGQNVERRWLETLASPIKKESYPPVRWGVIGTVAAVTLAALGALLWWRARQDKLGPLDRSQERAGFAFIMPWVIGFAALTLGPMVLSLILAFTRWTAMTPLAGAEYVGWGNYQHLFRWDNTFGKSLWVTTYYVILAVPLTQVAALAVALLMNAQVKGIAIFRTMYFVPSVVSGVALATLWLTLFNNDYGLINKYVLHPLTWVGLTPPDWFGRDANRFAIPAFVIMALWGVGGGMVIYLAGLKGIPASLYEAAYIDGAGAWKRLWNVTLPMLSPLIFFNLVMGIIGSFQVFTQAYVMTGPGPDNATLFYVLNLYRQAFEFHNMGYASAMAWILFVLVLILTLLVFRGSRGLVHYEGLKS